jgi:hypothetical protein
MPKRCSTVAYTALNKNGQSIRRIAARFGVAHTTVMRWRRSGAPVESDDELLKWLQGRSGSKPKLTQTYLASQMGRSIGQLTAWKKWGARRGSTSKMGRKARAVQGRADAAENRIGAWLERRNNFRLEKAWCTG